MALNENLNVKINADATGFNRGITSAKKGLSSFVSSLGTMVGIAGFGLLAKQAVGLASDLVEVQNVVDTTFGKMSEKIDNFAKRAVESFGLSELSAKKFASSMGAAFKSSNVGIKNAALMSTTLTALTGDMSSFYNKSAEMVNADLFSGIISNQIETLRKYGIELSVVNLENYALSQGIRKSYEAMSSAEKVALRYNYVLSVTKDAQGDFAKTSNSWANQIRLLSENWKIFMGNLGGVFISFLAPVVSGLNILLKGINTVFVAFSKLFSMLGGKSQTANAVNKTASGLGALNSNTDDGIGLTNANTAATKKNTKAKKDNVSASFDKFNDITQSKKDGSDDANSGAVGGGTIGDITLADPYKLDYGAVEIDTSKFDSAVKGIYETIKPTIDSLKNLDTALEPFKTFVWQGLQDFYNDLLVPIGKWTFGTGLPRLIDAFGKGMQSINWENINTGLSNLWKAITPFTINYGEGLVWIYENALMPLATWTWNEAVPKFLEALTTSFDILNSGIGLFKPQGIWFWDSFLVPLGNWTGGAILIILDGINGILKIFSGLLKGDMSTASDGLNKLMKALGDTIAWCFGIVLGKEAVTQISGFIRTSAENIKNWYNNDIAPWFTSEKWLGLWTDVKSYWATGWATITTWWNTSGTSDWFTNNVSPWFTSIKWSALWGDTKQWFENGWGSITTWWDTNAFANWFKETGSIGQWFTWGKWSTLWADLKTHFTTGWSDVTTVFDNVKTWFENNVSSKIENVFSTMWTNISKKTTEIFTNLKNTIRGFINSLIKGVNAISIKIGLPSIPEIPDFMPQTALAKGGLAYGEVNAVVGDNFNVRQDPEVISPLSTLKNIMIEALVQKEIISGGSNEIRVVLTLENGETLADMLIDPLNQKAKNLGYAPVFAPT